MQRYTCGEASAIVIARDCSQVDGGHHKAWVIDQMCRKILGPDYAAFVSTFNAEHGSLNIGAWDTGIAP